MKTDTQAQEIFDEYRTSLGDQVEIIFSKKLIQNKVKFDKLRSELNLKEKWEKCHPKSTPDHNNNSKDNKETVQNSSDFEYPTNPDVLEAVLKIQPHVEEFLVDTRTLTTWLDLQKGKYESGNSFGSEVIDQIASHVDTNRAGIGYGIYLEERRKLICKLKKHPWSEDAELLVQLHDYYYFWTLESSLISFARSYALIYDILKKNWDTIASVGVAQDLQNLSMY
ncbi:proteasome activator complex subunit 1 [Folsomia candida]|uniref:Proteasome activator complex subunit 1 n=1 Tax=Folsomia candida TaxID=158441 RepID=A0A226EAD7_FOLCA|nr:proteasome activator complex subunit 1 [Folsomia candida]OXA54178.1 Proteasome activator complex subunit 1 [Folsomia candida]